MLDFNDNPYVQDINRGISAEDHNRSLLGGSYWDNLTGTLGSLFYGHNVFGERSLNSKNMQPQYDRYSEDFNGLDLGRYRLKANYGLERDTTVHQFPIEAQKLLGVTKEQELAKHLEALKGKLSEDSYNTLVQKDPELKTEFVFDLLAKEFPDRYKTREQINQSINKEINRYNLVDSYHKKYGGFAKNLFGGLVGGGVSMAINPVEAPFLVLQPFLPELLAASRLSKIISPAVEGLADSLIDKGFKALGNTILPSSIFGLQEYSRQQYTKDFFNRIDRPYSEDDAKHEIANAMLSGALFDLGFRGMHGLFKSGGELRENIFNPHGGDGGSGNFKDIIRKGWNEETQKFRSRSGEFKENLRDSLGKIKEIKFPYKISENLTGRSKELANELNTFIREKFENNISLDDINEIKNKTFEFNVQRYEDVKGYLDKILKNEDNKFARNARDQIDRLVRIVKGKPEDVLAEDYLKNIDNQYKLFENGKALEKPKKIKESAEKIEEVKDPKLEELKNKLSEKQAEEYRNIFNPEATEQEIADYYDQTDGDSELAIGSVERLADKIKDKITGKQSKEEIKKKRQEAYEKTPVGKYRKEIETELNQSGNKDFLEHQFIDGKLKELDMLQRSHHMVNKAQKRLFDKDILSNPEYFDTVNEYRFAIDLYEKAEEAKKFVEKRINNLFTDLSKTRSNIKHIHSFKDRNGNADNIGGLETILSRDDTFSVDNLHIEAEARTLHEKAMLEMHDFFNEFSISTKTLTEHGKSFFDNSLKIKSDDMIRALYGDTSNKKLTKMVGDIDRTLEFYRTELGKHGIDINKLENYRKPQGYDPLKVGSTDIDFEEFYHNAEEAFDWGYMHERYKEKIEREKGLKEDQELFKSKFSIDKAIEIEARNRAEEIKIKEREQAELNWKNKDVAQQKIVEALLKLNPELTEDLAKAEAIEATKNIKEPEPLPVDEEISNKELARIIFDNIRTRNLSELGNKNNHGGDIFGGERIIFFKDAETDIKFNNKYGRGDLVGVFNGHINRMSKTLATVRRLGSEPTQAFNMLRDVVEDRVARKTSTSSVKYLKDEARLAIVQKTFDILSGKIRKPYMFEEYLRRYVKPFVYATKLGATTIASIPDFAQYMVNTMGSERGIGGRVKEFWKNVSDIKDQGERTKIFKRIMVGAEIMKSTPDRYGEGSTFGMMQSVADFVTRVSGLDYWTGRIKQSVGNVISMDIADNVHLTHENISNDYLKNLLKKYKISESEWDIIRKQKLLKAEIDGVEQGFFDPHSLGGLDISEEAFNLQAKVMNMLDNEINTTVHEPNIKQRATTRFGYLDNELFQSTFGMFKTFPTTVFMNQYARLMDAKASGTMASYMSNLMIWSVITGAMSIQANNLLNGKTTEDMGNLNFLSRALARGDFMGMVGNYIFEDKNTFYNRFGGVSSPISGVVGDVSNATLGNLQTLFGLSEKEDTTFIKDFWKVGKDVRPNLWFTKPLEVFFQDKVDWLADPHYNNKLQYQKREAKKKGQRLWLDRG